MKILYVEDDLAANIPRIINLFGSLLPKKVRNQLLEAENDASGYGASNRDIKEWLSKSRVVDAFYDFPSALATVHDHWQDYKLFILDRNLTDGHGEWDPDEVCRVYGTEDQEMLLEFITREGDFLVQTLIPYLGTRLGDTVYFLTANTAETELRLSTQFRAAIHGCGFGSNNFIQKADEAECGRLSSIIAQCDMLRVKADNLDLVEAVLLANPDMEDQALEIFRQDVKAPGNRRQPLMRDIRSIAESCLNALREKLVQAQSRTDDRMYDIFVKRHADGSPIGTRSDRNIYNDREIRSCFATIQTVCSECAVHPADNTKIDVDMYLTVYHAFRVVLAWTRRELGADM
jgi:hypothetical protein